MARKHKVLFLGLDAALPDLVKRFTAEGAMPNTKRLMERGAFTRLETIFPPLTAAGWSAIVTGAGAGTAGIPSLMVKLPGEALDHWHTSFDRRMLLSETLWQVGKRHNLKTALINWPVTFPLGDIQEGEGVQLGGALNPPFRYFYMPLWDVASSSLFSTDRERCNQIPGRAVKIAPAPAEGWENLPKSALQPLGFDITVPPTYVPGYVYHVLVYAAGDKGYDRVLISETKDASRAVTDIAAEDYGPWITRTFEARDGRRDGRFRFQLFELSPDGKRVKLYQSAVNTAGVYTVPESLTRQSEAAAGPYMEVDDPWGFMDGWIPEDKYVEQLRMHADWWGKATKYVLENKEWDMAYSWVGTIDHIEHVLYGGIEPSARVFEPDKYDWCMEKIRTVYRQVDDNIGRILEAVDLDNTYIVLISDHGFTHLDWNPYVKEHLARAGLLRYVLDLTHDDPSNLSIDWENTKCHPLEPCHAHIFINLKGRDPDGIVEPEDYKKVQNQIIKALNDMVDPDGNKVVALAITREEAGTLGIQKGAGYDRIGDVLYAWKPGYMSHPFIYRSAVQYRDGTTRMMANPELYEAAKLCRNFTGVHLALPALPEMHAVMVLAGPGIRPYERKYPARIIDVAPTIAKLLDIETPRDAEGTSMDDLL